MKRKAARKPIRAKLQAARPAKAAAPRQGAATSTSGKRKASLTDGIDALIAAQAAALKLPLAPSWLGGVKFNLQLILRLGAMVDEFALPDDAEPGPVFHA